MTVTKIYAGIGSRGLSEKHLQLCFDIGKYLASLGWVLHTGAALGADQAFARGAAAGGGQIHLFLPWASYEGSWIKDLRALCSNTKGKLFVRTLVDADEAAYRSVEKHHPAFSRLSDGAIRLHARNYLIVEHASLVIAFPQRNRWGQKGGTGQGMAVAESLGSEVIDLSTMDGYLRVAKVVYPKEEK